MKIDRSYVKFYLNKAEEARYNADQLKTMYKDKVEPFDIQETNTQGFILNDSRQITIAFRGTQQPQDWFTDLNGFQIKYPDYGAGDNPLSEIKVHQGFYQAYKSVRGIIHEAINRINPISITVCGHSLGGALSTLCAVDIQYNYPKIKLEVYTSGQPKVGNKAFEESFNRRVPNMIRTYMRRDIVPMCPPRFTEKLAGGKYYHVGTSNPIGPRIFLFGILTWLFDFDKKTFAEKLTNHSIDLYRRFS